MKAYLPVARAALISKQLPEDLVLLCRAGKLDCRQTNDLWFVAEEEIVDTLSMMKREVLEAEVAELRRQDHHQANLTATHEAGTKLIQATTLVLLLLFGTMSVLSLGVKIIETGNLASLFATFNNNLAAIFTAFK